MIDNNQNQIEQDRSVFDEHEDISGNTNEHRYELIDQNIRCHQENHF